MFIRFNDLQRLCASSLCNNLVSNILDELLSKTLIVARRETKKNRLIIYYYSSSDVSLSSNKLSTFVAFKSPLNCNAFYLERWQLFEIRIRRCDLDLRYICTQVIPKRNNLSRWEQLRISIYSIEFLMRSIVTRISDELIPFSVKFVWLCCCLFFPQSHESKIAWKKKFSFLFD